MSDRETLETLQQLRLRLRREHEFVMARIPPMNEEVRALGAGGLVAQSFYTGDIILSEPYEASTQNSGRAYLAALCTTLGFGVVQLDTDEAYLLRQTAEPELAELRGRFVPFDQLPVRIQSRLGSQVNMLLQQLLYDAGLS